MLLGQLGYRDTLLLNIKICKMQIIVDHLKITESKVICCWHMHIFLYIIISLRRSQLVSVTIYYHLL